MIGKNLRFALRTAGIFLCSLLLGTAAFAYPSGAPAGYTGSPGDGHHCTSCHNGSAATVTGWITSNIPAQGYTAGSTYTITVTVSGTGNKGFEVSPQNASGTQLGVLAAGTSNHLTGGTKYVTQNSAGSYSGTATWSFSWTAPAAGSGQVTFYGAFTVAKPNTKLCTLVVNENTVVPLGVTASANPATITLGQSSQLSATATGGTGTYTYSWTSNPAGFTSTQQNPSVSPTVTTQYTVTVSDGSGTAQGSTTVTVNIPPPLGASASATPSTITVGQSSQLSASASGGSGNYTFSWTSIPAGFTSTLQNPTVSPTVTTQYTVTVSDGSGTAQASTTVTVNAVPLSANATASPTTICLGESSQLGVTASGGTGSYTYSWTSLPAGFTSTSQNPVVTPASTTQYLVAVSDGSSTVNASVTVAVNQPATGAAGNDTTVANVTVSVPLHGTAANYSAVQWTTSGSGSFSAANALAGTYTFSAADKTAGSVTLTLTVTPQAPCTATVADFRVVTIEGPTGMAENNRGLALSVSPNPARGQVTVRVNTAAGADVTVSDLTGRTVLTGFASPVQQFDLTALSKGIYIVRVQSGTESTARKLVVE